ncbi:alpha-2-macroglobulin, partial [Candidatus Hakubella thermalkaliphila]
AHLLTDEKGEAMVTFKLPDSLTTWQISAVAASSDTLVGASKSEIITTKEFLIRPIVPRFVVMGDEVMLGAVVHNYSPGEITATVELKAQGFALNSPSSAKVKIPSNGSETVFWKGKVEDVERVRMTFAARSEADNLSDAVEMSIEALNQITPEVVAASGELEYTALQKILVSEDAVEGVGDLEIRTYATPLAGIQRGLDYLAEFPYGCIEQIVSSFLPQVKLKRLLDVTGLKLEGFDPDELEPMVDQGLQEIYAQQRYDGGWGWW